VSRESRRSWTRARESTPSRATCSAPGTSRPSRPTTWGPTGSSSGAARSSSGAAATQTATGVRRRRAEGHDPLHLHLLGDVQPEDAGSRQGTVRPSGDRRHACIRRRQGRDPHDGPPHVERHPDDVHGDAVVPRSDHGIDQRDARALEPRRFSFLRRVAPAGRERARHRRGARRAPIRAPSRRSSCRTVDRPGKGRSWGSPRPSSNRAVRRVAPHRRSRCPARAASSPRRAPPTRHVP
jgi:hypothetical protein